MAKHILNEKETLKLLNAVRNRNPQIFLDPITASNIANVGEAISAYPVFLNDFLNSVINKVGTSYVNSPNFSNPLSNFKRASNEYGDRIEEIFVGLTQARLYDANNSAADLFSNEVPDVQAAYHPLNRRENYKATIFDNQVKQAFTSIEGVQSLVDRLLGVLPTSNERDEYEYMKLLLSSAYTANDFYLVEVGDITTEQGLKKFITKARMYSKLAGFVNTYNTYGVQNTTAIDNLNIIMDAETNATADVEVLAKAFNMEKSMFLGKQHVIDRFDDDNIVAVMLADDWFVVADNTREMRSQQDASAMKTNYWLHVWQHISRSPFATSVCFVKSIPEEMKRRLTLTPPCFVLGGDNPDSVEMEAQVLANDAIGIDEVAYTFTAKCSSSNFTASVKDNKITVTRKESADFGEICEVTVTAKAKKAEGQTDSTESQPDLTKVALVQSSRNA